MKESTPNKEKLDEYSAEQEAIPSQELPLLEVHPSPTPQQKQYQVENPLEYLQLFTTSGYLALLVIGITKEILKYAILDINILPYFNLTDIVLSPLETLRQYWMIVIIPCGVWMLVEVFRNLAKNIQNKGTIRSGKRKKWVDRVANIENNWGFLGVFYASFVLGIAFQTARHEAYKLQEKLTTNTLEMTHQLTFQDKEVVNVAIIGQSSEFIFYVEEGATQISISPMAGIMKKWVALPSPTTEDAE